MTSILVLLTVVAFVAVLAMATQLSGEPPWWYLISVLPSALASLLIVRVMRTSRRSLQVITALGLGVVCFMVTAFLIFIIAGISAGLSEGK